MYFCIKGMKMISKEFLKRVLTEQRTYFLEKSTGVRREALERIREKQRLPHIHVISGVRRCGKSTLLRQVAAEFYHDRDFYYLSFEDERLLGFHASGFGLVYETMLDLFGSCKTFLIDEIQLVENFDSFVRRFYDQGFKFYLTGSNAGLLQEEISTRLTGRHVDTRLQPFSFREFMQFHDFDGSGYNLYLTENQSMIRKIFDDFLITGGMPEFVRYRDNEIIRRNYEDIITRDILYRKQLENVRSAKELYLFLINAFSQRFSYNSLHKALTGKLSVNTIKNYVGYLEETYLIRVISRFDYSVARQMANDKKVYACDNAFVMHLSTRPGTDKGWLLENLVSVALGQDEKDIFYYAGKKECDFITMSEKTVEAAYQVCWELNAANENRELEGMAEALRHTGLDRGVILTYDQEEERAYNGKQIRILPVWKWMLVPENDEKRK